jgi:glutathione S-transferase
MTLILYGFGGLEEAGLADLSPFVTKVELLLKMAGIDYEKRTSSNPMKAPKKKIPYIQDGERIVADSHFIRKYLEDKYQINFDRNIDEGRKAVLYFLEKYMEDHLYFLGIVARWQEDSNFRKTSRALFAQAPFFFRSFIANQVRKTFQKTLWLQGLGRHSQDEQIQLLNEGLYRASILLGDSKYFGGFEPCGADATIYPFLEALASKYFDSPMNKIPDRYHNISEYLKRMKNKFYPNKAPQLSST